MEYTLAVDIGGTKIAAGVMDQKKSWVTTLQLQSDKSSATSMYESVLQCMNDVINKAGIRKEQINHIGITIPGQLDIETGLAIYQNNLPWRNFPLGELLRAKFSQSNIIFEHDVVAAAQGEWTVRNLTNELFVYVTISTGISASIIYQGIPLRGKGFAGEIGFFQMDKGKELEKSASGSAMEKELKLIEQSLSLPYAFKEWNKGNEQLNSFFNDKAGQIARAIYNITATLDPHKIVLGGGVINHQNHFFELIKDHFYFLCRQPFQHDWGNRVERSILQGKAGLFGVASGCHNKRRVDV
ncbi:ROK family protein [Pseudogracilibacillus sp. SE30717A]|uniref:ROK family protein n=1 Tax=Pseudogracilibacillus sp. SE30717A TaxID=3098293 RepID=UPI00300E4920